MKTLAILTPQLERFRVSLMNLSKIIGIITSSSLLKTAGSITCGMFLSIHSHANDSDFEKFENTISITCYTDGEIQQYSYDGELFFMNGFPFDIDGELTKKKSGKNVFLIKADDYEFYINLDNKKVTVSMYGMKVENRCF
jgi:hypothetical protein